MKLTRSELFILSTVGLASVAGTVFVLYATILGNAIPGALGHILVASILSLPAAILIARIMIPGEAETRSDGPIVPEFRSSMDAIARGTENGLKLWLSIIVSTRRPPDTQIDATGRQHFQHAELLGHLQGTVVHQHHAARADAHVPGFGREPRDQDLWRGTRKRIGIVVLGYPVAVVAKGFAGFGEHDRFGDCLRGTTAVPHGGLIEDRQPDRALLWAHVDLGVFHE